MLDSPYFKVFATVQLKIPFLQYDTTSGSNWILTFRGKMMSTSSRSVGPTGSLLFTKRFSESVKESLGRNSLSTSVGYHPSAYSSNQSSINPTRHPASKPGTQPIRQSFIQPNIQPEYSRSGSKAISHAINGPDNLLVTRAKSNTDTRPVCPTDTDRANEN